MDRLTLLFLPLRTISWLIAAAFALGLVCCATAQSIPKMVYNMAYATNDESTLYIQGGFDGTNANYSTRFNQFYSLDLTRSWNTSYPLWSEMTTVGRIPDGLSTAGHTMSISHQKRSNSGPSNVTVWEMVNPLTFAASYNFDTKSWEELPTLPPPEPGPLRFYQAAVDPATDQVYIPGCAGTNMLGYSGSNNTVSVLPMPDLGNVTSWNGYSFVWNPLRESFFLFGGVGAPSATSYLYEYRPSTQPPSWKFLKSFGSIPPHLSEMCMVSASNGRKMLVFGGGYNGTEVGTLYLLDVPTMKWTQGPSSQPRKGMACTVSGNFFVVWGGISWNDLGTFVPLPPTPIVYSIDAGQWTNQFVAKGVYNEIEPQQGGQNMANKRGKEVATVVGSVVGVVIAVIVLIALVRIYRKNSVRKGQGQGKDIVEKGFPLAPDDQKIEEGGTEDEYFGNFESQAASGNTVTQPIESCHPIHWSNPLSPPAASNHLPCAVAAPLVAVTSEDRISVEQKFSQPRHNPQLYTAAAAESAFDVPQQTPRGPQV